MRLTGGEARGRRIRGPRGPWLRPTSDRVREALFDILASRVEGGLFLDAYAGTGAVGIEALSRGAAGAVFAENDPRALRLIAHNLALGPWQVLSEILAGEVGRTVRLLADRPARFGVVFVDPPYETELTSSLVAGFVALLAPAGALAFEHRFGRRPDLPPGADLTPLRTYRYGDTSLSLTWRRRAVPPE